MGKQLTTLWLCCTFLIFGGVAGQLVPDFPSRQEEEAKVMNVTIALAMFDQLRIMFGLFLPPAIFGVPIDYPEHASKEAFAPVSPSF